MSRMIFHNLNSGISVGVDVRDGNVYAAFSACHKKDSPTRKVANKILTQRLESKKDSHRTLLLKSYDGESVTKDVFAPVRDAVRKLTKRRNVKGINKRLKMLFVEPEKMQSSQCPKQVPSAREDYTKIKWEACSGPSCPA